MLSTPLHPYQDEATDHFLRRGSLLVAYEMGLGKTLVALACAEELLGRNEISTCVVVVPSAVKYQWAKAIARHTDVTTTTTKVKSEEITVPTEDCCVVVEGPPAKRKAQYEAIATGRPDYVILGYDNVLNDWKSVRRIRPELIVLDEATAIKSFQAKRTRRIKQFSAPYRLAMTGTPAENGKPEEIFSIMQWVDADILGRYDLFDASYIVRNHFGGVKKYKNLPVLHARLSEAMSSKSRLDPDVAPYMPTVDDGVWTVQMTPDVRRLYQTVARDLQRELAALGPTMTAFDLHAYYSGDAGNDNTARGRIMARHQALEMLLDHPDLLRRSAADYAASEARQQDGERRKVWPGSSYAHQLAVEGLLDGVDGAAKLDLLVEKMTRILQASIRNKVIVFSIHPGMLDLIEQALAPLGVACVQFHGELDAAGKAAAQARFSTDPDCRIFLSSHAGSHGVDLYMANYLINYDIAWASGKQDQINARHVRSSSLFGHVYTRTIVTQGTVEVRKYDAVRQKRRVAGAIQHGRGSDAMGRVVNDVVSLGAFLDETVSPA